MFDYSVSDHNTISVAQVNTAKAKGWRVVSYSSNGGTQDYAGSSGIPISDATFPDPNFLSYVKSNFDTDNDGFLSFEEIAAVTSIDVSSRNIASLTGIEHFTALTNLQCYKNQLTSLDVTNNTALTMLQCFVNQIRGTAMEALVNSLPKVTSGNGYFYVYNESGESNVITTVQVQAAKNKGWNVQTRNRHDYPGKVIPGDANGDGEVNAQDIATLRDYILGLNPAPFSFESANLNGDGVVDIVDLTKLIEMLK